MNKPPHTLVDRPAHRDWTIWLAGVIVVVAHLWDVVDIYLVDRQIYRVLGLRGIATTLLAELLLAAMTATFVVVVLTTSRRAIRHWQYRRYLTRNVTILTSPAAERRIPPSDGRDGAPVGLKDTGTSGGIPEELPSRRPKLAVVRLRYSDEQAAAPSTAEESLRGRG